MKLSLFGRWSMALFASLTLGLGMTACGGGTIGYMWVLGQQYNNIAGFKIDDYTGNLTQIINSPFNSNGSVPVSIVIKPGGRYVYVINQGVCPSAGCGTAQNIGQTISLFSVGGDGTLTFQQNYYTQGYSSQWAQMDATGSYLYVLDKYAPTTSTTPSTVGSITAFTSDPNTGRLALIQNTQGCGSGTCPVYWTVGQNPFQMKAASGCLYTVNAGNQSLSYYSIGAGGQLTYDTTGFNGPTNIPLPGAVSASSINYGSNLLTITDSGNNSVYLYTVGSSCSPMTTAGGTLKQASFFPNVQDPTWTFIDSTGKYLYVLNATETGTLPTTPYSTITAYTINNSGGSSSQLAPIPGAPYAVGSGPVCMSEDPTNQYMYISGTGGTITGKVLDPNTGELSALSKGSTFSTVLNAGCLAISGSVN